MSDKKYAYDYIDSIEKIITDLSDEIWGTPETCYLEFESAKAQIRVLKQLGFEVEENLAGIKTAFSGRYGSGKPVIGVLGEFDALSGLSQEAGIAEKKPIVAGGAGHGCGHNLLGSACIAAAAAIKAYLEKTGKSGTVIYYGCPAEEGGSGKAFMARDGVFDELDAAVAWHPGDANRVSTGSSLANVQVNYHFKGVAAHAAGAPHLGRSALDAVELMNIGVQFLREHVIQEARMHYAITNTGGYSPNVVQASADVLYLIRAPKTPDCMDIYERVNKIARGAAMMTDTEVTIDFIKACSNVVPNSVFYKLMYENMVEVGAPKFSDEDVEYAEKIIASFENKPNPMSRIPAGMPRDEVAKLKPLMDKPIYDFIMPFIADETPMAGSTDVGDVSWVCPTAWCSIATEAAGTPGHSWQMVAQGKSGMAHKGEITAAKVMAGTMIDMLEKPELIEEAKAEHADRLEHKAFVSPIPKNVVPRALGKKD